MELEDDGAVDPHRGVRSIDWSTTPPSTKEKAHARQLYNKWRQRAMERAWRERGPKEVTDRTIRRAYGYMIDDFDAAVLLMRADTAHKGLLRPPVLHYLAQEYLQWQVIPHTQGRDPRPNVFPYNRNLQTATRDWMTRWISAQPESEHLIGSDDTVMYENPSEEEGPRGVSADDIRVLQRREDPNDIGILETDGTLAPERPSREALRSRSTPGRIGRRVGVRGGRKRLTGVVPTGKPHYYRDFEPTRSSRRKGAPEFEGIDVGEAERAFRVMRRIMMAADNKFAHPALRARARALGWLPKATFQRRGRAGRKRLVVVDSGDEADTGEMVDHPVEERYADTIVVSDTEALESEGEPEEEEEGPEEEEKPGRLPDTYAPWLDADEWGDMNRWDEVREQIARLGREFARDPSPFTYVMYVWSLLRTVDVWGVYQPGYHATLKKMIADARKGTGRQHLQWVFDWHTLSAGLNVVNRYAASLNSDRGLTPGPDGRYPAHTDLDTLLEIHRILTYVDDEATRPIRTQGEAMRRVAELRSRWRNGTFGNAVLRANPTTEALIETVLGLHERTIRGGTLTDRRSPYDATRLWNPEVLEAASADLLPRFHYFRRPTYWLWSSPQRAIDLVNIYQRVQYGDHFDDPTDPRVWQYQLMHSLYYYYHFGEMPPPDSYAALMSYHPRLGADHPMTEADIRLAIESGAITRGDFTAPMEGFSSESSDTAQELSRRFWDEDGDAAEAGAAHVLPTHTDDPVDVVARALSVPSSGSLRATPSLVPGSSLESLRSTVFEHDVDDSSSAPSSFPSPPPPRARGIGGEAMDRDRMTGKRDRPRGEDDGFRAAKNREYTEKVKAQHASVRAQYRAEHAMLEEAFRKAAERAQWLRREVVEINRDHPRNERDELDPEMEAHRLRLKAEAERIEAAQARWREIQEINARQTHTINYQYIYNNWAIPEDEVEQLKRRNYTMAQALADASPGLIELQKWPGPRPYDAPGPDRTGRTRGRDRTNPLRSLSEGDRRGPTTDRRHDDIEHLSAGSLFTRFSSSLSSVPSEIGGAYRDDPVGPIRKLPTRRGITTYDTDRFTRSTPATAKPAATTPATTTTAKPAAATAPVATAAAAKPAATAPVATTAAAKPAAAAPVGAISVSSGSTAGTPPVRHDSAISVASSAPTAISAASSAPPPAAAAPAPRGMDPMMAHFGGYVAMDGVWTGGPTAPGAGRRAATTTTAPAAKPSPFSLFGGPVTPVPTTTTTLLPRTDTPPDARPVFIDADLEPPAHVSGDIINPGVAFRERVARPIREGLASVRMSCDRLREHIQSNPPFTTIPERPGAPGIRRAMVEPRRYHHVDAETVESDEGEWWGGGGGRAESSSSDDITDQPVPRRKRPYKKSGAYKGHYRLRKKYPPP